MAPEVSPVVEERGVIEDRHETPGPLPLAGPFGIDVAPHSPAVAGGITPLLDVGVTPGTLRIFDGAVCGNKRVAHDLVAVEAF